MSQQELLVHTARVLQDAGIEYMITGSIVSSLQGEPRSTHDIDLVVDVVEGDVVKIFALFPPREYYVSESAIRDAVSQRSMFNVVSLKEGDKLDFWLLTDAPFDRERFARRRVERLFGADLHVSAPEDTLLMKLSWAKRSGGSEKHSTDALRVYEVQRGALDEVYLDRWAGTLGVTDLLQRVRENAEPADR